MPITVQHQPNMHLAGAAANAAGYGQYAQKQQQLGLQYGLAYDQLAERKRQFDSQLGFNKEQLDQRNQQFNQSQQMDLFQAALQDRARRQSLAAQQASQQQQIGARFGLQARDQAFDAQRMQIERQDRQAEAQRRAQAQQAQQQMEIQQAAQARQHRQMLADQDSINRVWPQLPPGQQHQVAEQFRQRYGQELFAPPVPPEPEQPQEIVVPMPDGEGLNIPVGQDGKMLWNPHQDPRWLIKKELMDQDAKRAEMEMEQQEKERELEMKRLEDEEKKKQEERDRVRKFQEQRLAFIQKNTKEASIEDPTVISPESAAKKFDQMWRATGLEIPQGLAVQDDEEGDTPPARQVGQGITELPRDLMGWNARNQAKQEKAPPIEPMEREYIEAKATFADKPPSPLSKNFKNLMLNRVDRSDISVEATQESVVWINDDSIPFVHVPSQLQLIEPGQTYKFWSNAQQRVVLAVKR